VEKITSVEAYLGGLDDRTRAVVQKLYDTVVAAAPAAEEAVVYGMPGFKLHGKNLVGYMAFKDHYSLFPMGGDAIDAHREELGHHVTGKGTISFTYDERFPAALVKKVVKARAAMIAELRR
jgi:uncharacterized protein YdhG (YjbR/CyaY superfamily)